MTSPAQPENLRTYLLAWGLGTALIAAASIECLDIPLAVFFYDYRETWWSKTFAHITDFANGGLWYTVGALGLIAAFVRHKYRGQNPAAFTRETRAWLFMIVTMASSGTFINAVKLVIGRERPRLLFRDGTFGFHPFTFDLDLGDCSFPSGHTQSIWTAMLALSFIAPPLRPMLFAVAVLISASRVIIGAHYVSDVLGGVWLAVAAVIYWRHRFEANGEKLDLTLARARESAP